MKANKFKFRVFLAAIFVIAILGNLPAFAGSERGKAPASAVAAQGDQPAPAPAPAPAAPQAKVDPAPAPAAPQAKHKAGPAAKAPGLSVERQLEEANKRIQALESLANRPADHKAPPAAPVEPAANIPAPAGLPLVYTDDGWRGQVAKHMGADLAAQSSSDTAMGGGKIEVKPGGDQVKVVLYSPLLTPKGEANGDSLVPAANIKLASGILDAKLKGSGQKTEAYFVKGESVNGVVSLPIMNYGKAISQPVVEHLWGIGKAASGDMGFLVLDPNDPWVVYLIKPDGNPDLQTLAIGIVMWPDGDVTPLKALGHGKIVQGAHPELVKPHSEPDRRQP